ncbi:MAG: hypothetical protein JW788_03220 [Candidatus Omnitrophica bacterium]|nr:hypothetical protein [Candidatus Omnitrophota bacterium]
MFFSPLLRKALSFSFLGHLAVFGIFNVSFGPNLLSRDTSNVYFWGEIFLPSERKEESLGYSPVLSGNYRILSSQGRTYDFSQPALKPLNTGVSHSQKITYFSNAGLLNPAVRRKEPVVMLYPELPYHFLLYFKDRQIAHIEFMFNIGSSGKRSSVLIHRKVSSGNLELDLLSMRHISRYIAMQQLQFTPGTWQKVRIDLSAKE